jgi:hypothetical protein
MNLEGFNLEALILIVGMLVFIMVCTAGRVAWFGRYGRRKPRWMRRRKSSGND